MAKSLFPTFALNMVQPEATVGALEKVVSRLWDDDTFDSQKAQAELAALAAKQMTASSGATAAAVPVPR